jgi:hypothetical protein
MAGSLLSLGAIELSGFYSDRLVLSDDVVSFRTYPPRRWSSSRKPRGKGPEFSRPNLVVRRDRYFVKTELAKGRTRGHPVFDRYRFFRGARAFVALAGAAPSPPGVE